MTKYPNIASVHVAIQMLLFKHGRLTIEEMLKLDPLLSKEVLETEKSMYLLTRGQDGALYLELYGEQRNFVHRMMEIMNLPEEIRNAIKNRLLSLLEENEEKPPSKDNKPN